MSPIPPNVSTPAVGGSTAANAASAGVDQNMFLQLLVAQLKNQDPTQPMDSTTFVTQLAQFQQLEATTNMGASISGIESDANLLVTDFGGSSGAAANGSKSPTQS